MHFSSSVSVSVNLKEEPFDSFSLYVPMSQAAANIVDFDPALVSAEKPALYVCDVQNYKEALKGKLLDQWQPAFRQDTNTDLVLYVIVFLDDDSTADMWEIDDRSITFGPLTAAFSKLFFVSQFKMLFDGDYDGKPVLVPADPGTAARATGLVTNTSGQTVTIPAGTYTQNDGIKDWAYILESDLVLQPGEFVEREIFATTPGVDPNLQNGTTIPFTDIAGNFTPALPADVTVVGQSSVQGTDPVPAHEEPSRYFDLALALAYAGKGNIARTVTVSLVKTSFVDQKPNPADACWIRYKTPAEQKEAMTSLLEGDRSRYYWAALYLMDIANAWCLIHSEPVNILPLALEEWFAARNDSGQHIGNKLSLLRLSGTRIKPYGYPSWIYSDVNENDAKGFKQLDEMNVGYLSTIADNSGSDCALSSARGITGTPVTALLISKFIDYLSAQQTAELITAKSTNTRPKLTDETVYKEIQALVASDIGLFATTNGRIYNVVFTFPPFSQAKTGLTKIEAPASWSAVYKDDLDEVTVTGSVTVQ
jgi:hypothetical protein